MKLTAKQIQKLITPAMIRAGQVVLLNMANAKMEREKIDTMHREILDEGNYLVRPEFAERRAKGPERITDPKLAYLMSDEQAAVYNAYIQRSLERMGYNLPDGYCPALIAESEQTQAEHLLIELSAHIAGVTVHQLFCSAKGMENYRKYVDLLLKLVTNHPSFTSPLKNGRIELSNT
jgi:hypothetical protein